MKIFNKINSIQIRKFRKFDDIVVKFEEGNYFVLSGRNGTGKTSVLEAINIAFSERSSKFTEIKESDFYSDEPIEFLIELDDYFFLSFDDKSGYERLIPCKKFLKIIKRRAQKERGSYFSPSYEVSWSFLPDKFKIDNKEFNEIEVKFEQVLGKNQKIVRFFEKIKDDEFNYSIKTKPDEEIPYPHIGFQYMKKLLFPEIFYFDNNRERELLVGYNTMIANIVNELNWRYKKGLLKDKNKKKEILNIYQQASGSINSLLNTDKDKNYQKILFNNAKNIFSKKLKINELDLESLSFFFFNYYQPYTNSIFGIKTSQEQIISVLNIGSGISNLLSLALSISFAQENDNPIIILIDEPELHLQADLQKNLQEYLNQNKNFQTIIATHSHLFINKENTKNNVVLESTTEEIQIKYCDQIDISDLQFRLLGNSIEDLFIPEKILLVEGKYDKNVILKCIELLKQQLLQIQIIPVGGKDNILNKSEDYGKVLEEILKKGKWYSDYIIKVIKIIVDNNVPDEKIDNWVTNYNFNKEKQIKKIERDDIEYLYPEGLIKECVENTKLRDGSKLNEKSKDKIIKIILEDDKLSDKNECQQVGNRISKARLNSYIVDNITIEILKNEGKELNDLTNWVILDKTTPGDSYSI